VGKIAVMEGIGTEKERQEKRHGYTGQELTFGAIE
jgi:hypothetical protein